MATPRPTPMPPRPAAPPPAGRSAALRAGALVAIAVAVLAALGWYGPIAQPAAYHAFADTRAAFGIPNAADVLSNLAFALVGLAGLAALRHVGGPAHAAWTLFCAALVAVAAGSAGYHWAPADATLVWDRIPIALACVALSAAFFGERGVGWAARPATLAAGAAVAVASVFVWRWTGDLRLYIVLQLLPMLIVPAALLLRTPARRPGAVADAAWWGAVLGYAAARVAEVADHAVFAAGGVVSGHTLKHLLAAAGAAWLIRGLVRSGSRR